MLLLIVSQENSRLFRGKRHEPDYYKLRIEIDNTFLLKNSHLCDNVAQWQMEVFLCP